MDSGGATFYYDGDDDVKYCIIILIVPEDDGGFLDVLRRVFRLSPFCSFSLSLVVILS